jgi:hypothetical protein
LKQPGRPCGALNVVVPLVAESLGGLGKAAFKLFAEIARSQASSRHLVGHILRRLIDISQIAVQKGNFRRLQKAVSLCLLDDPFNSLRGSRDHLTAMNAVGLSQEKSGPDMVPAPRLSDYIQC